MPIQVSQYRVWVDERNDPVERKQIAYAALDAFEQIESREQIQREELESIVVAARSRYLVAWDIGTVFLVRLAVHREEAREAIIEIMHSKKAYERAQIVWALQELLPKDFRLKIIRMALSDRSKEVRRHAASRADVFCLTELLPELEARLEVERDSDVQYELRFHIAMLTDGYRFEYDDEGNPRLTVKAKRGWVSPQITKEDIDQGKLASVINDVRSRDFY